MYIPTPIVFITDTTDANARGRVTTRVRAVFGEAPIFIGVAYPNQLEAAGNLIDQLDALEDHSAIVFVNVAPRSITGEHSGNHARNENGTAFCYFRYGNVLIIATLDGLTLSLVKKFGLTATVQVIDLPKAALVIRDQALLNDEDVNRVISTQFRSYEILPKIGAALRAGIILPTVEQSISGVPDCPSAVWLIDGHGNCKTTLIAEEMSEGSVTTRWGTLPRYQRLKDVPDGVTAIIEGSSGLGSRRFLEIVTQGGSVAQKLGIRVGDKIH